MTAAAWPGGHDIHSQGSWQRLSQDITSVARSALAGACRSSDHWLTTSSYLTYVLGVRTFELTFASRILRRTLFLS